MPRNINVQTAGRLKEDKVFAILVRFDFPEPLYVHSRTGEIEYDGNTYLGMGEFGSIAAINEDNELSAQRVSMTLSNIDGYWNSKVLTDGMQYQNKKCYIYLALLDEQREIIGEPIIIMKGTTGNLTFTDSSESAISIEVANYFTTWNRTANLRYTDTQQRELYPNDTGLRFVQDTLKAVLWRGSDA
jgi:hypothetical protein